MQECLENLALSSKRLGGKYDLEMPKMRRISMMPPAEVFEYLQVLDTSMYKNKSIARILDVITISEGYRYLTELSILNEKEKSRLEQISDRSPCQELGSS